MDYTRNMLKGFGTSIHVQEHHYRAALKVNAALADHKALLNDRTLNRAQRSPMVAKLQHKLQTEAARDVKAMENNLAKRLDEIERQEAAILASMPLAEALTLTQAMKGLDASEMIAATRENKTLALAMAIVPSSLSGFSKDQAMKTLIDAHYPDLKEANDALEGDLKAYESLARNVDTVVRELGNDLDVQALNSIFDPKRLDVTPTPRTMAEQNAEMARLEAASGIAPTASE